MQFVRDNSIFTNNIEDEIVMMSIRNGDYYNLNPTASKIWEILEKPHSIAQICEKLVKEYLIDEKACLKEINVFIENLLEKKIIKKI